ncbi:hypothetical protein [Methylocaldum gracile]|uniref:hypothetical protein n=1 Tax=Methylocaldum sp. 0917 TaxID=2485163 RepID=UPI003DA09A51
MSFAATAAVAGTAIAAGGSIASGAMASGAAGQSANDIRGQADYNSKVTWQQLQQNDQAFAPWVSGGRTAQGLISYGLGMGGVTDADLSQAQRDYQAALASFEAGQQQKVKKKYQSRWLAQQEQLKKNLDDAGRRLADIQRAAEVQKSGAVRPGEFSENLWREFSFMPEDARKDPTYQFLLDKGLISEGKWETDPGYLFRRDEGQKIVENSAAARGGLLSGQTGKALQQYGQNFASNEFGNIYDRYRNLLDSAYGRAYTGHLDDYKGRVAERESKFDKLTGQSGTGLKTLGTLAELAFGSQKQNNAGALDAASLAGKYNVLGAEARADGFGSALNSIGSLAMYAGGGGFGGSGGGNTSTFANNLGANTAFQNFGPKFGSLWG